MHAIWYNPLFESIRRRGMAAVEITGRIRA